VQGDCGGQQRLVLLKLAGLLHDVAKPQTKMQTADGRWRFFGHEEQGAAMAEGLCKRLRFGNRETAFVSILVGEHLRPTQLGVRGQPPSQRALYRFFRDMGDAAPACLILTLADGAAAAGPRLQAERWRGRMAFVSYVLAQGQQQAKAAAAPRLVTGNDVMAALDLQPGPLVGRLMAALDEAIGAGEVASREDALAYAAGLARDWRKAEEGLT
jgi:poly(A) polymerase